MSGVDAAASIDREAGQLMGSVVDGGLTGADDEPVESDGVDEAESTTLDPEEG